MSGALACPALAKEPGRDAFVAATRAWLNRSFCDRSHRPLAFGPIPWRHRSRRTIVNATPNTEIHELTDAELESVTGGDLRQVSDAFTPSIVKLCEILKCGADPMSCQH